MTISPKTYDEINAKLVGILDSYKEEITQYDILIMSINLLISYMEVLVKMTLIPKDKLFNDVVDLMRKSYDKSFVSKN